MSRTAIARSILIIGIAFVFLYFGIEKFVHPNLWIVWMPDWMDGLLGLTLGSWLSIVGVTEIVIAVLLLVPVRIVRQVAIIAASLHLFGIVMEVGWNDVGVRDIGLMFMSVSLWFLI
ncbi:hypothetical protein EXS65_04050 [Candidatus Peribacteria bacterium]|nr:hypothetical protein [Candidatus Peribacteria bacterium]